MAVPFGFSVGDFLAVGRLIREVALELSEVSTGTGNAILYKPKPGFTPSLRTSEPNSDGASDVFNRIREQPLNFNRY
jgi:hypothetical protein